MKSIRGFSLVELSIVLFIGAVLLTAGLRALNTQMDNSAYSTTKARQEIIKDALSVYLGKNGRLPCPDTDAVPDGIENRNNVGNVAVCVKAFGVLPYATLGLSKEMAIDGWDNFIAYGVSPKWTLTYNAAAVANTPQTTVATNAFNVGYSGTLTVSDRIPATNAAVTNISTTAVVVLISYGKNGNGAITIKGSQNVLPVAGSNDDELTNVNVGGLGTQYIKREYSDTQTAPYGGFDDLVRSIEATELVAPLTKDGSLSSSTGTLNQTMSAIQDAVLGSAIASHLVPGNPYLLPVAIPAGVSILDPWGNGINYAAITPSITATTAAGVAYQLTSNGPDGITATADDIVIAVQVTRLQGIFGKLGY